MHARLALFAALCSRAAALKAGGDGGAWRISRARLDAKWSADIRKRRPRFLPFVRARQWARAQWMTSEDEWTEWVMSGEKRMALVPSEPDSVYASSGWSSWDDFLNGPVDPDMPPPKARNPAAPQPPRTPTKISMCASDGEGEADAAVDDDDAPPFGGVPIFEIALVLAAAYAYATGEMS